MDIDVKRCCHDDPDFISLVTLLDEDLTNRYGERQKRYNALNITNGSFNMVVAYCNEKPVGCGCFKALMKQQLKLNGCLCY